jgi:uncharacterized membrane protein YcaP (DUF421 family)
LQLALKRAQTNEVFFVSFFFRKKKTLLSGAAHMWDHLLLPDIPLLNLAIRAIAVFLGIVLLLRLSGKRQMGQLTATEFVVVLLISNAVQNAMNGGDNSLTGGLFLATILIALAMLVGTLCHRFRLISRLLEGTPTRLVHNGRVLRRNMDRERLSNADLKVLLRKHGVHDFHTVDEVILESDGSLSVTRKGEQPFEFEDA